MEWELWRSAGSKVGSVFTFQLKGMNFLGSSKGPIGIRGTTRLLESSHRVLSVPGDKAHNDSEFDVRHELNRLTSLLSIPTKWTSIAGGCHGFHIENRF